MRAVSSKEPLPDEVPVYGRGAELDAVSWLLDGVARGSGRVLVLEGEAGIGKSHLAEAAGVRAAAAGMQVIAGSADELERDRPGRILLALADGLRTPLAQLLDDEGAGGGSRGFALVEAVTGAVEEASADTPVLVIAEDLQWADELSLRGLASLGRRIGTLAVGLVATLRPSPRPALIGRVLEATAPASTQHLLLAGLDETAVAEIVAAATGAAPGPGLAVRLRAAAGNPLYVTELLRALDEAGALTVASGTAEVDDRPLPASLRATIVRRLAALTPATAELLRFASLLGREFGLADLATIVGRRVVDVAAHLHPAVEAAVVSGDGEALAFRHDLIREAVYDDIAPAVRRDLHVAAARALAAVGAPPLQVARHYGLGARTGDLNAVEWLERAARESLTVDPASAVELLGQAIALAPPGWSGLSRMQVALLEPLAWCGHVDQARALGSAMLDQQMTAGQEFATRAALAIVSATGGDLTRAIAEAEQALAVDGAPVEEAAVLSSLAVSMGLLRATVRRGHPAVGARPRRGHG